MMDFIKNQVFSAFGIYNVERGGIVPQREGYGKSVMSEVMKHIIVRDTLISYSHRFKN